MKFSSNSLTNSNKILKQILKIGEKHLVVIDESIIQKLKLNDDIVFVEQEWLQAENTITMKIKKLDFEEMTNKDQNKINGISQTGQVRQPREQSARSNIKSIRGINNEIYQVRK